jgi:F-type H+-transporting ATPase subunit b
MDGSLNMVGYGLAAIGPGVGIGLIFAAYINGVRVSPRRRVAAVDRDSGLRPGGGAGDHRYRARLRALIGSPISRPPTDEVTMNVTAASSLVLAAGEPNPLLPHTGEIILGIVVFLILVLLVRKFVVPNFEKAYADRTEAIEGGIARAEKAQAEADAALEQYRASSPTPGTSPRASVRRPRSREHDPCGDAPAGADRGAAHRATAHSQIEAERKQVVLQLRSEIGSLATSLAERIVGESLQDEVRQRRTVERFLAELESRDERRASESAARVTQDSSGSSQCSGTVSPTPRPRRRQR